MWLGYKCLDCLYYHFLFLLNTVGRPLTNDNDVPSQEPSSEQVWFLKWCFCCRRQDMIFDSWLFVCLFVCFYKLSTAATAAGSNEPTNATQGSFFIPQQTKVLIWSIFSNMFKDDWTVMFLLLFLSEFHWVAPFCSWCWHFPNRFLSGKLPCFQESVHVTVENWIYKLSNP